MILHAEEHGTGRTLVLLHGLFGHAANFGTVQKWLSRRYRVIALDLRNHGSSPHAPTMSYAEMTGDVLETLRERQALPCALVGHSLGGKVAMQAALAAPAAIDRLVVADIAPVRYPPAYRRYVDVMAALPLSAGLTRSAADAALVDAVPEPEIRAFLLQNLRLGSAPSWRINLPALRAALPEMEGWPSQERPPYPGPALFIAGARSNYIRSEHQPLIRVLFPAARFVTLKNAGHWLHAENAEGFVGLLEAFFG
jgi:pimeloyl-ACP methyl ester carboxylesterase